MKKIIIFMLMMQFIFLVGCSKKDSMFSDKNYYQLNAINDESNLDDNRGIYSGGAYYNAIKINEKNVVPDDGCGFLVYKFVLNSKMDDATNLNELFKIDVKAGKSIYTSEKVYKDSTGKTIYVCVDIPLQEFNKKEKDLRAIASIYDKKYRVDSTYLSYDDFYKDLETAIETSNKIYEFGYNSFGQYAEAAGSGLSLAQLKTIESTVKTGVESFEETFEELRNITYRQDIPETVSQDYKKWSDTVRKNLNLLESFDWSTSYGIDQYSSSISYYLIDLVLTEKEMGFSTDTLLEISDK